MPSFSRATQRHCADTISLAPDPSRTWQEDDRLEEDDETLCQIIDGVNDDPLAGVEKEPPAPAPMRLHLTLRLGMEGLRLRGADRDPDPGRYATTVPPSHTRVWRGWRATWAWNLCAADMPVSQAERRARAHADRPVFQVTITMDVFPPAPLDLKGSYPPAGHELALQPGASPCSPHPKERHT